MTKNLYSFVHTCLLSIIVDDDVLKMAYQHKKDIYTQKSKEILENVLTMKSTDYDSYSIASTIQIIKSNPVPKNRMNSMPVETEQILSDTIRRKNQIPPKPKSGKMEQYESTREYDSKHMVEKIKQVIARRGKNRNYLEFRDDYLSL